MKYGRVVDLRQPSFSSRTLSELRLRSAALLPQSPPLFLRQHLFFRRNVFNMCACKEDRQFITDSLVSSFRSIELCERGARHQKITFAE